MPLNMDPKGVQANYYTTEDVFVRPNIQVCDQ